jgi:drug/metabolite transporter (DMT)-like permease
MDKQNQAYAYALVTVLFWVTVASAFKLTLQYLDFLHMLLYSSATSALVLFFILLGQNKLKLLKTYTKQDYLRSAALGFLNPFFYYVILFKAYELLLAQEAQPLNQTWAVVLPILSIIILKQRIKFLNILALLISFFGVLIISTQGDLLGLSFTSPFGVFLALFSAIIWSLFWLYNVKDERDEVSKLFLNFIFGFIYILIAIPILSPFLLDGSGFGIIFIAGWGLIGAVYIGLFEMGITFVLWLRALQLSKTTAQVSNFIYLVPFISLIVIHLTVGETIYPSTIIGLIFIIGGILLQQYVSRKKNNKKENKIEYSNKGMKRKVKYHLNGIN